MRNHVWQLSLWRQETLDDFSHYIFWNVCRYRVDFECVYMGSFSFVTQNKKKRSENIHSILYLAHIEFSCVSLCVNLYKNVHTYSLCIPLTRKCDKKFIYLFALDCIRNFKQAYIYFSWKTFYCYNTNLNLKRYKFV